MTTLVNSPVTSSARQRVAKSLESESASIAVILGGFAVVAASILGAGLLRHSTTADTAVGADATHRGVTAAGSAVGGPIAETTRTDPGTEHDYRDGVLYSSRDAGASAMQAAIAVGMPPSSGIRLTNSGAGTPAAPKHSEWWWVPAGLGTVGAGAAVLRLGLRRREAETSVAHRHVAAELPAN